MHRTLRIAGALTLVMVPLAWAVVLVSLSACDHGCADPDGDWAGGFVLLLMLSVVAVPLAVLATVSPFPHGRPRTVWQRRAATAVATVLLVSAGLLAAAAGGAVVEASRQS